MEKRVRTFNDGCSSWTKDRKQNIMYLRYLERLMNDRLKLYGYVFLRDIYERIGHKVTSDACKLGWYYDNDNCIDFRINPRGTNPNVKLTFEVENIIDKI